MYHSITIGDKNTWDDWHLIPATRPLFNPPTVKENMVNIPGGDGVLDLTASLAGRPTYNNRTGSWTFYVQNGFKDWSVLYSEIMVYLHGQTFKAILEDDPAYFYEGRFSVNQWKSDKDYSQIVINYNVGPYKKEINNTDSDWLWDPFNFETGIIRNYKNLSVLTSLTVVVEGDMMDSVPVIIASASGMQVTYEGKTYSLSKGANTIPQIVLHSGENTLIFAGQGTITIENTGGRL
mgnify:FL=1|jgi:hypothetical protein